MSHAIELLLLAMLSAGAPAKEQIQHLVSDHIRSDVVAFNFGRNRPDCERKIKLCRIHGMNVNLNSRAGAQYISATGAIKITSDSGIVSDIISDGDVYITAN